MPPFPARSVGWRTAGGCLALASVLAGSHPAAAADWQILYRLSETQRVSDNIELRPDPDGPAFSSHTGAGLDIRALTPTAEWGVTGDIGKIVYLGEGAPDDRKRMIVSARSDLLKRTRSTDFNLNAHFDMAPATGLILTDPVLLDPCWSIPSLPTSAASWSISTASATAGAAASSTAGPGSTISP